MRAPYVETELQKIYRYCGITHEGTRSYGPLEIDGTVTHLMNRFIKRSGDATSLTSFTRKAFYAEVDTEAHANPRNRAIIDALPDKEKTIFRVKYVKYGNHNAMWEVLSGQLYALTGLKAPDARLFLEKDLRESGDSIPEFLVASPKITGYYDLGTFFVSPFITRFINEDSHEKWERLRAEVEAINKKDLESGLDDEDKMKRIHLMSEIYELLPDYFHTEIEKAFAASKFIGNWDFANFYLNNIGCCFTLDREFRVVGLESAFVDFGNSGMIGFGGKYKEASLERANRAAKPFVDEDHEYDPELEFSLEEKGIILRSMGVSPAELQDAEQLTKRFREALASNSRILQGCITFLAFSPDSSLSPELKASLRLKSAHHILPHEAGIKISDATTGLLTTSDLPRNLPFAFLLRRSLQHKTTIARESFPDATPAEFYRDSEIEVAFRLSLIPDEAIDALVTKWYLSDEFPTIFPVPEGFDAAEYSAEKVARIFKDRRDALVKMVPPEVIAKWHETHKAQALTAESEVELAITKRTTNPNPNFDKLADVTTKTAPFARPEEMIVAIRCKSDELSCLPGFREEIADLESALGKLEENPAAQKFITSQIEALKMLAPQKHLEALLDFVESNIGNWKKSIEPKLDPSCDFFNLKRFREIYRTKNHIESEIPRQIRDGAENQKRNCEIHDENTFVFDCFMRNLEALGEKALTPDAVTSNPFSTPVAQHFRRNSI